MVAKIDRRAALVATDDGRFWRLDFPLWRHLIDVERVSSRVPWTDAYLQTGYRLENC
jgi:hypothetical protein